MPPDGRAAILLAKANEDAIALRVLAAEAAVADAIIGFHAQQAVEKALKAVLVARVGDAPRTHDIVTLLDLARASGVDVPDWLASTEPLVRYAVVQRYEETLSIDDPLDRSATVDLFERVLRWVRGGANA